MLHNTLIFAAILLAALLGLLGGYLLRVRMHEKPYVPLHGDHEPSWTTTGGSYRPPIPGFSFTGFDMTGLMETAVRGETTITQVCNAHTAQMRRCGRVRTVRRYGRVMVEGFKWSEEKAHA